MVKTVVEMRKILLALVVLFLIIPSGFCQEKSENFPFISIQAQSEGVRLKLLNEGVRWLVGLNTDQPSKLRLSNYGEVFKLKVGDRLELVERHQKVVAMPIHENNELMLKKVITTDSRSVGGSVKEETTLISLNSPTIKSLIPIAGKVGTKVKILGEQFHKTNNIVTIRNSKGAYKIISNLQSNDGQSLTFVIPAKVDLPYPILEGGIDVPPFNGNIEPGIYEVIVENGVGKKSSNAISFEVTVSLSVMGNVEQ